MNFMKKWLALVLISTMLSPAVSYAWTMKMNFNNGPLGTSVEDRKRPEPVFTDAAGKTVYSPCSGFAHDGQCAKMNIQKGHDGWGTWGGRVHFKEIGQENLKPGDEVWYSVKVFIPTGFDYTGNPYLKFLRLHTKSSARANEGYNDLYIIPEAQSKGTRPPFLFLKEQQDLLKKFGDASIDKPMHGRWESYQVYIKLDYLSKKNGGSSIVRMWKNGKLLAELPSIQSLKSKDSYADAFLIFTYWNGGNPSKTGAYPTKDQSLFIDDLIITTDKPSHRDSAGNPMIDDTIIAVSPPINLRNN